MQIHRILFIICLISGIFVIGYNFHYNDIKATELNYYVKNDSIEFSYDLFRDTSINFISFDIPIGLPQKESFDRKVLDRLKKSKFERNNDLSIYNDEYKINKSMILVDGGKFAFENLDYYYFFYSNFYYNCNPCPSFILLYSHNRLNSKVYQIPLGYQASITPFCFGDFDHDHNLDYIHWDYGENVKVYNIKNDRIMLNKHLYLHLNEGESGKYYIDFENSRWLNKFSR